MSIRIDLTEMVDGSIRSRVSTGVDKSFESEVLTWALLDHMFRKIMELMIVAKSGIKEQCKLQDLPETE